MGIAVSIILIAAGAVLAWAVNASVSGVELETIGWILLVVGALGLLLSIATEGRKRRAGDAEDRERVYVDREPAARRARASADR